MAKSALSTFMESLGWPVLRERHESGVVHISSSVSDVPVVVTAAGESLRKRDGLEIRHLCFVRLMLGDQHKPRTRWALLSDAELKVQAAGGEGWVSLESGFTLSRPLTDGQEVALENFFRIAEQLVRPGEIGELRDDWAFECLDQPMEKYSGSIYKISGISLTASPVVGTAAVMALGEVALVLPFLFCAVGVVATGIAMMQKGFEAAEATFGANPLLEPVVSGVKASEVFAFGGIKAAEPGRFLVVHVTEGEEVWNFATLGTTMVVARSKSHDLILRIVLHSVGWPDGTLDRCRTLPDGWATIEIEGPIEKLNDLPERDNTSRGSKSIRWQMGSDELASGGLIDWLHLADVSILESNRGPYR